MNGPLNAVEPFTDLYVVVPSNVEQHKPRSAGAINREVPVTLSSLPRLVGF